MVCLECPVMNTSPMQLKTERNGQKEEKNLSKTWSKGSEQEGNHRTISLDTYFRDVYITCNWDDLHDCSKLHDELACLLSSRIHNAYQMHGTLRCFVYPWCFQCRALFVNCVYAKIPIAMSPSHLPSFRRKSPLS